MHGLISKIRALPGARDQLIDVLLKGVGGLKGCLSYVVAQDPVEPDCVWVTEVWADPETHHSALSTLQMQRAMEESRALLVGFEQHVQTNPVGGFGLANK